MDYLVSDSSEHCKNTEKGKIEEYCAESVEATSMMAKLRTVISAQVSTLEMHSNDGEILDQKLNSLTKEISSAELDDERVTKLKSDIRKTEQKLKLITEHLELLTVTMEKSYDLMQAISDWQIFKLNMNKLEQIVSSEIEDQNVVGENNYLAQIITTEEVESHVEITNEIDKNLSNENNNEGNTDNLGDGVFITERKKENENSGEENVSNSMNLVQENYDEVLEKDEEETNKNSSKFIEINNKHSVSEINNSEQLLHVDLIKIITPEDIELENENKNITEIQCLRNDDDQHTIPNISSLKIINLENDIDNLKFNDDTCKDSVAENLGKITINELSTKNHIKIDYITSSTQTEEKLTSDKITETEDGCVVEDANFPPNIHQNLKD